MQPIFNKIPKSALFLFWVMIAVYATTYFPSTLGHYIIHTLSFIPARYTHKAWHSHVLATCLSPLGYAFLHANFTHIFMNLAMFLPFGAITARAIGDKKFLLLFILGALAGALCFYYFNPRSILPLVGSSASIAALVGFVISASVLGRKFPSPFHTAKNTVVFMAIWIGFNVIAPYLFMGNVSWEAHLGGFALGFVIAPLLRKS